MILWLALLDRLKTRARLHQIGVCDSNSCAICGNVAEDIPHLFFDCHFSVTCKSVVFSWLGFHSRWTKLHGLNWIRKYSKSNFRRIVAYATMACLVYHIWLPRNSAVWRNVVPTPATTVQLIQFEVKHRIKDIMVETGFRSCNVSLYVSSVCWAY